MDLCQEVLDGISLLKNDSRISRNDLENILDMVIRNFRRVVESGDDAHNRQDRLPKGEQKLVALSISCLMIESVRQNLGQKKETQLIQSQLDDSSVLPDFASAIISEFTTIRDDLHHKLSRQRILEGFDDTIPELLDVDWRQEVVLKCDNVDRVSQVKYLMSLKTNQLSEDGEDQSIDFSCSVKDLTDLLNKIKECSKVIEDKLQ